MVKKYLFSHSSLRLCFVVLALVQKQVQAFQGKHGGDVAIEEINSGNSMMTCPPIKPPDLEEYHLDTSCNRNIHNSYRNSLNRGMRARWLQESGSFAAVPDAKTLYCPDEDSDDEGIIMSRMYSNEHREGFETMWIVKNTSSRSVVVAWLQRIGETGKVKEVAALNPQISPAHMDKNSILKPGEWKAIHTYEGHAFRVRQMDQRKGYAPKPGRILMEHRVGMIPITNRFGIENLETLCNGPDKKPMVAPKEAMGTKNKKKQEKVSVDEDDVFFVLGWAFSNELLMAMGFFGMLTILSMVIGGLIFYQGVTIFNNSSMLSKVITAFVVLGLCVDIQVLEPEADPDYARTMPVDNRPCNTLDIGFRNQVGCPINAYYTGMHQMRPPSPQKQIGGNIDNNNNNGTALVSTSSDGSTVTPKSCHEEFKFHLGLNPRPHDFMWGWDSPTKFEGTYVGHSFSFRLAKNEKILVDSFTVEPTYVPDCPDKPLKVQLLNTAEQEALTTASGMKEQQAVVSMVGTTMEDIMNLTSYMINASQLSNIKASTTKNIKTA